VTPQQLFARRREARRKAEVKDRCAAVRSGDCPRRQTPPSLNFDAANNAAVARPHSIELDIEGSSVWIWPGADAAMVAAIIGALKAVK
jgi:hypothetical protein